MGTKREDEERQEARAFLQPLCGNAYLDWLLNLEQVQTKPTLGSLKSLAPFCISLL